MPNATVSVPTAVLPSPIADALLPNAEATRPFATVSKPTAVLPFPLAKLFAPMAVLFPLLALENAPNAEPRFPLALLELPKAEADSPLVVLEKPKAELKSPVALLWVPTARLRSPLATLPLPIALAAVFDARQRHRQSRWRCCPDRDAGAEGGAVGAGDAVVEADRDTVGAVGADLGLVADGDAVRGRRATNAALPAPFFSLPPMAIELSPPACASDPRAVDDLPGKERPGARPDRHRTLRAGIGLRAHRDAVGAVRTPRRGRPPCC